MLALRLVALAAVLPLILATHVPLRRQHRRTLTVAEAAPLVARARPAELNAGHKSARRALKRSLKKKAKRACAAAAATATSTFTSASPAYTVEPTATSTSGYAAPSDDTSDSWAEPSSTTTYAVTSSATWLGDWAAASSQAASTTHKHSVTHSSSADSAGDVVSSVVSSVSSAASGVASSVSGLLQVTDDTCGWCDSSDSAPNGSEDWLNCGVTGSGWTPPYVTISELSYVDLDSSGPFAACSDYFYLFNEYGPEYNIPPIMLASFALQESSCNQYATGGNGEAGLMQLAEANCDGAPDGNCYDLDFNVKTGASYFSSLITQYDGNVLEAIGSYNGWYAGLTVADATAAASEGDCSGQNNLDYITQMVNGWMQGQDGSNLGTYFNLASC
ncbi:hypothetical protein Q5752_005912 [Cryptotrichosporon argae]